MWARIPGSSFMVPSIQMAHEHTWANYKGKCPHQRCSGLLNSTHFLALQRVIPKSLAVHRKWSGCEAGGDFVIWFSIGWRIFVDTVLLAFLIVIDGSCLIKEGNDYKLLNRRWPGFGRFRGCFDRTVLFKETGELCGKATVQHRSANGSTKHHTTAFSTANLDTSTTPTCWNLLHSWPAQDYQDFKRYNTIQYQSISYNFYQYPTPAL